MEVLGSDYEEIFEMSHFPTNLCRALWALWRGGEFIAVYFGVFRCISMYFDVFSDRLLILIDSFDRLNVHWF
jgi:hypothetical protein